MTDTSVGLAKLSLTGLLVGTILMQILLPVYARQTGDAFPEVSTLVVPYSAAAVLTIASIQVALVAAWLLISAIPKGAFFSSRSAALIDAIRAAIGVAAVITAITAVHLLVFVGLGGPGVVLGLLATCVVGVALVVLLTLGKKLYLQAAAEHDELASVI